MNLLEALVASGLVRPKPGVAPRAPAVTDICAGGKVSYATKRAAQDRMRRSRRQSRSTNWRVYRGGVCGCWPMSSQGR